MICTLAVLACSVLVSSEQIIASFEALSDPLIDYVNRPGFTTWKVGTNQYITPNIISIYQNKFDLN